MHVSESTTHRQSDLRLVRSCLIDAIVFLLAISVFPILTDDAVAQAQTPQSFIKKSYPTPEVAVSDLINATKATDRDWLRRIFGPDLNALVSGDSVQSAKELEIFSSKLAEKNELVEVNDNKYILNIGQEGWPFPIPLVREGNMWVFNTKEGIEELLNRRIGENEIRTILASRAYALAQWEYFLEGDWDNDLVHEFAQKLLSTPGQKDGLYWPTVSAEAESPLGVLIASARSSGYLKRDARADTQPQPYYGYYYKILKGQGPYAPGGAYSYIINGNMIGGFALVAYPARYGASGIMTFIVNQQGRVYQRDLGERTTAIASAMTVYNPDAAWKVAEESLAEASSREQIVITGQEWQVIEIDAMTVTRMGDRPLAIKFDGDAGKFTVSGSLNLISGLYALNEDELTFSRIISTRRAGPPEMMRQEDAFMKSLAETVSIKLEGADLILVDAAVKARLRLSRSGS